LRGEDRYIFGDENGELEFAGEWLEFVTCGFRLIDFSTLAA